jgi:DnaJ like chaperone protein
MTVWRRVSELAATVSDGGAQLFAALSGVPKQTLPETTGRHSADTSVAFTMAIIALSAKMAKADGVVVGVEVDAFQRAFQVGEDERANVGRLFDQAKQDVAGYELYAERVATALKHDKAVLADVLDSLFHIATADRALHPAENVFLQTVATRFGLTESEFRHRRAQFVADPSSPYDVLGIDPQAPNDALKQRHRKLVRENHPDLLIGRGVPAEVIAVATRRLAAINDAYAVIARERRL